jgi:transketolase
MITYKFSLDRAGYSTKGKDITNICVWRDFWDALEAARQLALTGVEAEVINIHTIKPIDADMIIASVQKTGAGHLSWKIITYSEGRLGSFLRC